MQQDVLLEDDQWGRAVRPDPRPLRFTAQQDDELEPLALRPPVEEDLQPGVLRVPQEGPLAVVVGGRARGTVRLLVLGRDTALLHEAELGAA